MTFHDAPTSIPDPEVVPKAKRRRFSAKYKQRILEEADNCTEPGNAGQAAGRGHLYPQRKPGRHVQDQLSGRRGPEKAHQRG